MSTASSTSLTSNRPAPPSPAVSRRTSGVSGALATGSLSRTNSNSRSSAVKSPERSGDRNSISNRQSLSQLTNLLGGAGTRMSLTSPASSPIPPTPSTAQPLPSSSAAAASTSSSPSASSSSKPAHRTPIKIRDFAYPALDPRHFGLGADGKGGGGSGKFNGLAGDVPKHNRVKVLNKALMGGAGYKVWKSAEKERKKAQELAARSPLSSPNSKKTARASIGSARSFSSVSSASVTSDEEEEEDEDEDDGGWAGFKWGMGRLSWHFGNSISNTSNTGPGADEVLKSSSAGRSSASSGGFPSKSDLDRNFTTEDNTSSSSNSSDTENDGQGGVDEPSPLDYDHADEDEYYEEAPLYPGLYRALYAFEPEGTAEMALEEDQIVRVLGRGGGVGWAIVEAEGDRKHALVPESYLEPVQLDHDEDEEQQHTAEGQN